MHLSFHYAGLPDRCRKVNALGRSKSTGLSPCNLNSKLCGRRANSAALDPMKKENIHPADGRLGSLLREARTLPALPPRFQQNVWRRIEDAEASVQSGGVCIWLEGLVASILRPRFAYATVAALMLAGISLGAYSGARTARHDAEARYVASVAPSSLR